VQENKNEQKLNNNTNEWDEWEWENKGVPTLSRLNKLSIENGPDIEFLNNVYINEINGIVNAVNNSRGIEDDTSLVLRMNLDTFKDFAADQKFLDSLDATYNGLKDSKYSGAAFLLKAVSSSFSSSRSRIKTNAENRHSTKLANDNLSQSYISSSSVLTDHSNTTAVITNADIINQYSKNVISKNESPVTKAKIKRDANKENSISNLNS
jgi:hypothetical protein